MYKNGLAQRQSVTVVVLTGDVCESETELVLGEVYLPHINSHWLLSGHNSLGYDIR